MLFLILITERERRCAYVQFEVVAQECKTAEERLIITFDS